MLRNLAGLYRPKHRSHDLLKYKERNDAEFEIVGFKEGDGRLKGTVVWICRCSTGTFDVVPDGPLEQRKELLATASSFVGKQLTVLYQGLFETGKPRFPIGKAIRPDDI